MLLSHTILRHQLTNYSIDNLIYESRAEYIRVMELMNDNSDGQKGAFSIQNVARMSLLYNKYPGEWHGPGSMSNVIKDLNKVYAPI